MLHALFNFLFVNNPQLLFFFKELMRKNAFPTVGAEEDGEKTILMNCTVNCNTENHQKLIS